LRLIQPPAPGQPSLSRGRWLGWALAGLILAGCLLVVRPRDVIEALGRLSGRELATLLLIATANRLLTGLKWGLLLRLLGVRLPLARAVRLFYQAAFAGALMPVPVGGDLLRAYWVGRGEDATPEAVASLVAERLLGLLSTLNWALLGGTALAVRLVPDHAWLLAGFCVPAALAADVGFALSLSGRVRGFVLGRLERLGGGPLRRFGAALAGLGRDRRGLLLNAGLTFVEHGLQILLLYAAALSLDVAAGPVAFGAAAAVQQFFVHLPVTPDGLGVAELGAIGVLGLVGVTPAVAVSLSLVTRAVMLLAMTPGAMFLLAERRGRVAVAARPGAP
jgi:glycosyltransferase 2 family protein